MKTNLLFPLGVLGSAMLSTPPLSADISVRFPIGGDIKTIEATRYPLSPTQFPQSSNDGIKEQVTVVDNVASIKTPADESFLYVLSVPGKFSEVVYLDKGDTVDIEISSISPYHSVISGSEIMDAITGLQQALDGPRSELARFSESGREIPTNTIDSLNNEVMKIFTNFIEENPSSKIVPYVVASIDDENFDNYYDSMSESAKNSILYPMATQRKQYMDSQKEELKRKQALETGSVKAPDFSLENTYGKRVSLSAFRGKWVILDFWGSWCIWCIKGFPELKEAYTKYNGELEIVGIDCRETKEAWLAGIKKYELPWVNLYCPDGNTILREYGVQGFPTKAIIDPDGNLRNITVGHDPDFYVKLEALIGH